MSRAHLELNCQYCGTVRLVDLTKKNYTSALVKAGWMVWWTSGASLCPKHSEGVIY